MADLTIGLAALRLQPTIPAGVDRIVSTLEDARDRDVELVCFPETYLPGLRGIGLDLPAPDQTANERALERVRAACERTGVAAIVGMEWLDGDRLYNRAYVVDDAGDTLGYQTKNQITPGGEEENYDPDGERALFEFRGVPFGIAICHEGWRYPETVRWAATRGARIVFQPQWTGRPDRGRTLTEWGSSFYEYAMLCRAGENSVFFASVNVAMDYQNSATSLVSPDSELIDHVPYGEEALLTATIDPTDATREYAERYDPELYPA